VAHGGEKFGLGNHGGLGGVTGQNEVFLIFFLLGYNRADAYVLKRFSLLVQNRNDGCRNPLKVAILFSVLNFSVPRISACDGPPQIDKKFYRMPI